MTSTSRQKNSTLAVDCNGADLSIDVEDRVDDTISVDAERCVQDAIVSEKGGKPVRRTKARQMLGAGNDDSVVGHDRHGSCALRRPTAVEDTEDADAIVTKGRVQFDDFEHWVPSRATRAGHRARAAGASCAWLGCPPDTGCSSAAIAPEPAAAGTRAGDVAAKHAGEKDDHADRVS